MAGRSAEEVWHRRTLPREHTKNKALLFLTRLACARDLRIRDWRAGQTSDGTTAHGDWGLRQIRKWDNLPLIGQQPS
jgi:hypothetical protein